MKNKVIVMAPVLIWSVLSLSKAYAQQEKVDNLDGIVIGIARDASYIVTAPLRINKKGVLITLGAGAFIYGVGRLDSTIQTNIQHRRYDNPNTFFQDLEKKGGFERLGRSSGVMAVCGSFYAGGIMCNNNRARKVAFVGVESWLFNDMLTKGLKYALGRQRPEDNCSGGDTNEFRNFSGNSSMPSGHASTAYCMASVIATEYDSWIIDFLSYGTASIVAFSRLYRNVHWASDIAASMVLGITIGKTTYRLYNENPKDWTIIFTGTGVAIAKKF